MKEWEFNADIAKVFVDHARQHIPNYDRVIDKSVAICERLLDKDAVIVEVGCATGETLRRLNTAGFTNIHGVDSSREMLDYCNDTTATLHHSEQFPRVKCDAVICNWTLHFVKSKISYITSVISQLKPGGIFILSEKTSKDPTAIEFYHDIKRANGVSEQEIADKARSVENIMHINSPEWYLAMLTDFGFERIQIFDADWCFTSFVCFLKK